VVFWCFRAITPDHVDHHHSFHTVGLPFADVLSAGSIEQVFRQHDALFGQEDIFSTQIVLWAFLAQALQDGKGASCAAAVEDIATYMHQTDQPAPCGDTGDYCGARAKLDLSALRRLTTDAARQLEADAEDAWLWKSRHVGIVSDGFLPSRKLKLDALGIEGYFDAVIFTEALGRESWKPSPAGFEALCKELQFEAGKCTYVADNPSKDFVAPNALGWRTIQLLLDGQIHSHKPAPPAGEPQIVVNSIDELDAVVA